MFGLVMALASGGEATPEGAWITQDHDAIVRIVSCPGHPGVLCGRIERIMEPAQADARDAHNPDPSRRSRAIQGLEILSGFKSEAHIWSGGSIYDPDDGDTHSGPNMRLDGPDRLVISKPASLLVLKAEVGRQVWTRVAP
jgi:hypothetical protein